MGRRRLGRLEVLGAWLGVWTPPRGAEVPPVPWRPFAALAAIVAVALLAGAALLVPGILDNRERADERAREAAQRRHAEALANAEREQRPRTGRGATDPGRGASDRDRLRARTSLLAVAQDALRTDAGKRDAGRVRGLDCEPFPRGTTPPVEALATRTGVYQCVAVTSRFGEGDQKGVIGIPFRLLTDFAAGRYAFCRVVPLSDRDRLGHPLPAACRR